MIPFSSNQGLPFLFREIYYSLFFKREYIKCFLDLINYNFIILKKRTIQTACWTQIVLDFSLQNNLIIQTEQNKNKIKKILILT